MFADFPRFVVLVWFLDHFWRISAHLPDCAMQLKQTEAETSLYLGRILKLFIQNLNENVKVHIFGEGHKNMTKSSIFVTSKTSVEISSCFRGLLRIV